MFSNNKTVKINQRKNLVKNKTVNIGYFASSFYRYY